VAHLVALARAKTFETHFRTYSTLFALKEFTYKTEYTLYYYSVLYVRSTLLLLLVWTLRYSITVPHAVIYYHRSRLHGIAKVAKGNNPSIVNYLIKPQGYLGYHLSVCEGSTAGIENKRPPVGYHNNTRDHILTFVPVNSCHYNLLLPKMIYVFRPKERRPWIPRDTKRHNLLTQWRWQGQQSPRPWLGLQPWQLPQGQQEFLDFGQRRSRPRYMFGHGSTHQQLVRRPAQQQPAPQRLVQRRQAQQQQAQRRQAQQWWARRRWVQQESRLRGQVSKR
jgi:hypothetical protein